VCDDDATTREARINRPQSLRDEFVREPVESVTSHAGLVIGARHGPPFRSCRRRLTVALRAALSFDTRVELIWMSPLSVSGGIGSSQKGSLRARIRTDYYLTNPHKVADRRTL
jgi:hypothetical protein